MPNPIFGDMALQAISFALDGLSLRQRVTAQNIANVDTPGYKAQLVSFETQLQHALDGDAEPGLPLEITNTSHLNHSAVQKSPFISVGRRDSSLRNDGNNVDIDVEMTTLAETTLRYQALAQLSGMKLGLLKSLVRDIR
jgi:flagellar basal-body rod protein FlgB